MKEKKLIWQVCPPYVLGVLLALVLMLLYAVSLFKTSYMNQTTEDLKAKTVLIEPQVLRHVETQDIVGLTKLLSSLGSKTHTRFTLIDPKGVVLADSDESYLKMNNHANRPEIMQALSNEWGVSTRYSRTLQTNMLYVAKSIKSHHQMVGVIRSSIPINELDTMRKELTKKMIACGALICLFSAMMGIGVSRKISAPINTLIEGANQFSKENFDFILPTPKTKEFRKLTDTLNRMAAQLKDRMATIINYSNEKDAILLNMVEGVITVNNEEKIITINQAAQKYVCSEESTIVGKSVNEVIRNTTLQQLVKKALLSQALIEENIVLKYPQNIHLHAHGICLLDTKSMCTGALIVLHDVTHIRRLEDMRKEFVANVSHELKTPITLIKGFLETLQMGAVNKKKERDEFLSIIQRHANRLDAIIEDLLILSTIEQKDDTHLIETSLESLNGIIQKAMAFCEKKATQKDSVITFHSSENIVAKMNASLIEQAIINLIDNAIKYSPQKSHITVSLSQKEGCEVITVSDQGCGIAKKHHAHLFERFYRVDKARSREQGGTGLGLAIVNHIAKAHNGVVSVKSEENKGSQFSIHLPIHPTKEKKYV